ncbi:hypothetical protein, partial [Streptomyces sp. KLMMK]|uniref:hypothetical protein n=1 Tax=Streptomyces sp. KLMMK TaxID=3109353 RepID=UPI00300862E2
MELYLPASWTHPPSGRTGREAAVPRPVLDGAGHRGLRGVPGRTGHGARGMEQQGQPAMLILGSPEATPSFSICSAIFMASSM